MMINDDEKHTQKNATAFVYSCGKSYKCRQGLSVHKKKCLQIKESSSVITSDENREKYYQKVLNNIQETIHLKKIHFCSIVKFMCYFII